jgi:HlyD family secretion protein
MKKKIIIISAIIIVLGGFTVIKLSQSRKVTTSLWETIVVQKGDLSVTVTATGEVKPLQTVEVGTQVSGVIAELKADFNSKVKKGQVIAQLDTRTLKSQLADANAMLEKAKVQLRQAERDFKRMTGLLEQKAVAQVDYDNALDAYETAKANLISAQVSSDRAQVNLNYGTITAPIDGVIISRAVEQGQTVAANFSTPTLFKIANDLTKMKIEASIDEADIGQVKVGQKTTFTVDAYTDLTFEGKVQQIRLQPTTVNNVVTYTVVIDVANPDLKLMPGMTANLTIYVEDQKSILKVPSRAFNFSPSTSIIMKYSKIPDDQKKMMNEMKPSPTGGEMPALTATAGSGSMPLAESPGESKTKAKDMGKLWLLKNDSLIMAPVKKGVTDGQYYEIIGLNVKEGDTVIVATNIVEDKNTSRNDGPPNPFLPSKRK